MATSVAPLGVTVTVKPRVPPLALHDEASVLEQRHVLGAHAGGEVGGLGVGFGQVAVVQRVQAPLGDEVCCLVVEMSVVLYF